jgi:glycerol-3-phosphate O-acyltransferase
MKFLRLLFGPLYWLAGKIFSTWARPAVQPDKPAELLGAGDSPVCYVLESGGLADTLALERSCKLNEMPSPTGTLEFGVVDESRRTVTLRK